MLECDLCGLPITEEDFENSNVVQTSLGNWHNDCINEYEDDAEYRRGDEECDERRGT